jgi:DNA-binding transcriptional regulator GbsR (MarR family)
LLKTLYQVKIETTGRPPLDEIESAIIDIFIRATKILGYPKSIGEIYGILYVSDEPLCMEDIILRLGISLGTASQGLKVLKGMRAVKSNHIIGKRREYFTAEFELEELINRYIRVEFTGYLKNWQEQQASIRAIFQDNGAQENHAHLEDRLNKLENLHAKSEALIHRICEDFAD